MENIMIDFGAFLCQKITNIHKGMMSGYFMLSVALGYIGLVFIYFIALLDGDDD